MTTEFFKFQNTKAASEYAASEGSSAVQYGHAVRVVNPKNRPTKLATTKIAPDIIERLEAMAASEPASVQSPPSPDESPDVDLDPTKTILVDAVDGELRLSQYRRGDE